MDTQSSLTESSPDDDGPFLLHPTPQRPLRQPSTVSSRQKLNLRDIDRGVCFITGDDLPTKAIQDAHIIRRKLPVSNIERYERLWGLPRRKLNVDSRFNRVHLRADIHIAYDDDLWTFVPDLKMLKMIELSLKQLITEAKAHCIDQIIRKPDTNSRYNYVFIPIRPDAMSPRIHRLDDSVLHVCERPFLNFPLLNHHSHPYYAIVNAYTKFSDMNQPDIRRMTQEHRELRALVIVIHSLWEELGRSSLSGENEHGDDLFGAGDAGQHSNGDSGGEVTCHDEKGAEDPNWQDSRILMDQLDYADKVLPTTLVVRHTFSSTNSTHSIATSPLIPPSLKSDSIVQPDDSASVASIASTGLRSDYEEEGGERQKDNMPLYHHNVDYWRKNVLQDVGVNESPFRRDALIL